MSHRTIIDGYNLMHAAGLARGKMVGKQLELARLRLMQRLAYQMTKEERAGTTVVFDAKALLEVSTQDELIEGIRVRYPEPGHEADELIEHMIAVDPQPRKLRIVSSDRRLHRAARERMAVSIPSDRFLDELDERRPMHTEGSAPTSRKAQVPLPPKNAEARGDAKANAGDVDYWLQEFGEIEVPDDVDLTAALEQSLLGKTLAEEPAAPKKLAPATQGITKKPTAAQQPLIVPLPSRPDLATLPSRGKRPPVQVTPVPEPLENQPGPERIDNDLNRWKDVLQQVLDEEAKKK
jgi:predicted RNA-binding protein with PIN domain